MTAARSLAVDPYTTRVLAPNPGWMTLEGTNTYLLGAAGSGEVVVVDPGPDLIDHRRSVDEALAARDARPVAVVLTHHHGDHADAAGWADDWGVEVWAFTPRLIAHPCETFRDGETLRRAGVVVEGVHTPGHSSDHLCLRVAETGAVLTGDHVLGRGTTVVAWPDGDMRDYLASLRRLAEIGATALYPGHGPVLEDPQGTVDEYLSHRLEREGQIVAALEAGDRTPVEIVQRVYAEVDPALHGAAEASVRAHLDKLVTEGRARHDSAEEAYLV